MPHAIHRIVVCLDGSPQGNALLRQAAALARRLNAELVGLRSLHRPLPSPSETFARGTGAIHEVLDHLAAREEVLGRTAREAFAALVSPLGVRAVFRAVWDDDPQAAGQATDADLVVLGHPRLPALPEALAADRLLLGGARPVLLVPETWDREIGRRVLVAWNGSPAARQAIDQAAPLIAPDAAVTVLVVDGAASPDSTAEIADRLGAAVMTLDSRGDGVAEAITAAANEASADLVVLGGYSRSPSLERWFGGVTRTLLAGAAHPLLLSHVPAAAHRTVSGGERGMSSPPDQTASTAARS